MCGFWWESSACRVAVGIPGAVDEQDRLAALGRPAGGRHRVGGVVARGDHHVGARRCPCAALAKRSIAGRQRVGVAAGDRGRVADRSGSGTSPIRITWAPPVGAGAGRRQRAERVRGGRRQRPAAGEQDRRADRRRHQRRRRRSPPASRRSGASVTACGWVPGPCGRIHGQRHAGGVGDRVAAGDARGVLGRHRGKPSFCAAWGVLDCPTTGPGPASPLHQLRAAATAAGEGHGGGQRRVRIAARRRPSRADVSGDERRR